LFQLAKTHKNVNKVVNIKKNNEIPSTPIVKLKFNIGIHLKLVTNWKDPTDLSKKIHKYKDKTKVKLVVKSAIILSVNLLNDEFNIKKIIPIKGVIKI